jgi:hypothetical protein
MVSDVRDQKTFASNPNVRVEAADGCRAMVVAILASRGHPQGQPILRQIDPRLQEPHGINRVGAGLHPNARLYLALNPHGNGVVEMKASDHPPERCRRSSIRW